MNKPVVYRAVFTIPDVGDVEVEFDPTDLTLGFKYGQSGQRWRGLVTECQPEDDAGRASVHSGVMTLEGGLVDPELSLP